MTLIMWRGPCDAAPRVCVRLLCLPESRLHRRGGQAPGHLASTLIVVGALTEEIWLQSWGASVMDFLHLLQNVIPDVPVRPAGAGERAMGNNQM